MEFTELMLKQSEMFYHGRAEMMLASSSGVTMSIDENGYKLIHHPVPKK